MASRNRTALVISYQFSENGAVASHRNIGFVRSLIDAGYEVTLITCKELSEPIFPNEVRHVSISNPLLRVLEKLFDHSKTKNHDASNKKSKTTSPLLLKYINRYRMRNGILFLGRMPDVSDVWYFAIKKYLNSREDTWDVAIGSYAPYSNLLVGSYLKKKGRVKVFIADYRDPWAKHHLFKGIKLLRPFEKLLEKKVNASANLICTATPLLSNIVDAHHVLIIKNGFYGIANPNPIRTQQKDLIIVHTGSIYKHKQDIEPFFAALAKARELLPNAIKVHFAGNEYEHIMDLAIKYHLTKVVHHHGPLRKAHCDMLLKEAHAGVSFDLNDKTFAGVIPVKLNEYIKYDLAVLQLTLVSQSDATKHLMGLPKHLQCDYDPKKILDNILRINDLAKTSTPTTRLQSYSQSNTNAPLLEHISKKLNSEK